MEPVQENIRLLTRAYWLIKLRWIAILCFVIGTYISSKFLYIALHDVALYVIATLLSIYNVIVFCLLKCLFKVRKQILCKEVKRVINLQICVDLFLLTILIHFSGGIENPLVLYFIFHMIIASILLSKHEIYLLATFAVFLFGILAFLEYSQITSHYCLTGFVSNCLKQERLYFFGTFLVFTTALYLAVYMANYITIRLKQAELAYREDNLMLQEKDHIKDGYVMRVTHDIKGHLATIQGCLAVVVNRLTEKLDDQEPDLIRRAHTRVIKLTNFVKALLRLTQMRISNRLEKENYGTTFLLRLPKSQCLSGA